MGKSKGLKVAMVDKEVTPQSANSESVVVARQTDGDENISTSERLFGDLTELKNSTPESEAEPISQSPLNEIEKPAEESKPEDVPPTEVPPTEKVTEVPVPETQPQTQPEIPAGTDELSKKVRIKVDGKEEDVTVKELRDQYQIRKHLNMQSDRVGEERRRLAEERRELMEIRQQQAQPLPTQDVSGGYQQTQHVPSHVPSEFGTLNQEVQFLKAQLNQVMEGTKPVVYQSNRQRVSDELKGQGFEDFLDYIPKMEAHIVSVQNPQLVNFYDTPDGAKALYFQLKALDLKETMSAPRSVPQEVRTVIPSRPPITRIDGGSQPSVANNNDDSSYRYKQSFKRASNLGDDKEAWNDVLRQKGIIPE